MTDPSRRQAHARLSQALAELGDPDSPVAVALMIELAVDSLYGTEYDAMRGWATRAGAAAEGLDAPELTAGRNRDPCRGGRDERNRRRSPRASRRSGAADRRTRGRRLARRLDALSHLATAEMYLDRFEASGRHAERALRIGRATGQGDLFPLITPMLGTALWVQGRVRESGDVLDGAVEAARLIDNVQGAAWNLYNRSFAAFAAGDIELVIATARESSELARELDESVLTGHVAWALAAPLLEIGDAEQAAHLLLTRTGGEELRVIPGGWRAVGLELLTRVLLTAGRREDAQRAAAAASACADAVGLPLAAAMARLAEAALALDDGDPARAANARSMRRRSSRRSVRSSTRPWHGCAPGRRWGWRAIATPRPPNWGARPPRSSASAPPATGPRPSRSSADSESAPGGAGDRAPARQPASRR